MKHAPGTVDAGCPRDGIIAETSRQGAQWNSARVMRDSVAGEDPWNSSCSLTWPPATQSSMSAPRTDQLNNLLCYQLLIEQMRHVPGIFHPMYFCLLCAVITQAAESVRVAARYLLPR